MALTFVLGGARSGKSRQAHFIAMRSPGAKAYIATAEALDEEMKARIAEHQEQRGEGWVTYEAPLELVKAFNQVRERIIVIDCITLWISNLLLAGRHVDDEVLSLCAALAGTRLNVIVVSNEVGQGIVPDNALARKFRDEQGLANQRLAAMADEVVLVAAGLPLVLKQRSPGRARRGTERSGRGRRG